MKRILIVIQDMESGGGQKSLLSFLKCLENSGKVEQYQIDLIVAKPTGIFYAQIPNSIHLCSTPKELMWLGSPLGDRVLKNSFSIKGFCGKAKWIIGKRIKLFSSDLNEEQKLWTCWKKLIPQNKNRYDIAISYMNGFPNYYVMDKVCAQKKVFDSGTSSINQATHNFLLYLIFVGGIIGTVSKISNSKECYRVAVSGTTLFVSCWATGEVELYDISVVDNPQKIRTVEVDGRVGETFVDEDFMYVVTGYSGMSLKDTVGQPGYGTGNGLTIFDITDITRPVLVSTVKADGSLFHSAYDDWSVCVNNGFAYFTNSYGGLYVYDVSNPAAPERIGKYTVPLYKDKSSLYTDMTESDLL